MTLGDLPQHPLSAAFPSMSAEDADALMRDIRDSGLRNPVTLYEGMVLDGWHRYRACVALGIACKTVDFSGDDPVAFVRSQNWHRRHLTASQRAAVEVALTEWRSVGKPANSIAAMELSSTQEIAKRAAVSTATVERAKAATRAGLGEDVKQGRVTAEQAAKIAKLPESQRAAAIKNPRAILPKKPVKEDQLRAKVEELESELEMVRDGAQEAIRQAEAAAEVLHGDPAKKIIALEAELAAVRQARDDLLTENAELKREVKFLRGKLKEEAAA